jgi:hypothetical protein
MQYRCFSFNVYVQREVVTGSFSSQGWQCYAPPPRPASPPPVATVANKLTGVGGGWCVSIWAPSLPGPNFMHVWSSVCCLFRHLPLPPVKVSRASLYKTQEMVTKQGPESEMTHERWHPKQGSESEVIPGGVTNYGGTWSLRWGDTFQEVHTSEIRNK